MTRSQLQSIISKRQSPSRVLVLGSTGMVGRSWTQLLDQLSINHDCVSRPKFDLMDPSSITQCVTAGYDLVVNAAAWTDVDGAESDETGATRANAHAVNEIATRCAQTGALLLTYSTDYVFSGNAMTPYAIEAPIEPVNAYGRSKAMGESMLRQSNPNHILIRTSWVYAPWGKNFVRTIRTLAQSKAELQVVNDQQGRPTSAQQLARSSLELYLNGALGTWHMTDEGECTWFDLARQIIEHEQLDCKVNPCRSDAYPRPAQRPAYSTLDIQSAHYLIGNLDSWTTQLHKVLKQIEE